MLFGDNAFGSHSYGHSEDSSAVASVLTDLLSKPYLDRTWIIRAKPRDESTSTDPPTLLSVDVSTLGYRSLPTDDEEIQFFQAVKSPYAVRFGLGNRVFGHVSNRFGQVVLDNSVGDLTSHFGEDWIGREIDIHVGPSSGPLVLFALVAKLLSRSISIDLNSCTILVDDYGFLFDDNLQENTYAGTGGLEGGSEIEGNPKPICIGSCRQIEPILVDGANRVYQVHDGSVKSISGVDVKGLGLTFRNDVADITTASPLSGEYSTSLSTGYVKLGSDPSGVVTCPHVEGHNSSSLGYVDTLGDVIKLLSTVYGDLDGTANIDPVAFSSVSSKTAKMGAYIEQKGVKIRTVIEQVNISSETFTWLKPDKVLTVGQITDPAGASVDFSVDRTDILSWDLSVWEIPIWKVTVGYRPYHRVLSDTDLDSSIALATRKDLGQAHRFVTSEDSSVKVQIARAREVTILTSLDSSTDAQSLADSQLALRKKTRYRLRISLSTGIILRGIGDIIQVSDERLPGSPRKFAVVSVDNRAETNNSPAVIILECFG